MREKLKHFLGIKLEDEIALWDKAVFVFDTNTLLNLYRYSKDTRDTFLDVLRDLQHRIWIPYQVVTEFGMNRFNCISTSQKYMDTLKEHLGNYIRQIRDALRIDNDPPNDQLRELKEYNNQWISKYLQNNEYVTDYNEDPILSAILELFEGKTGEPPKSNEKATEMAIEAKRRIDKQIPPGYKDSKKKGEDAYGDYFIWRQILDYATEKEESIIFITDDAKEDWWNKSPDDKIGPRIELKIEFSKETGKAFHMYESKQFIQFYSKHTKKLTDDRQKRFDRAVKDMTSLSLSDEQRQYFRTVATSMDSLTNRNTQSVLALLNEISKAAAKTPINIGEIKALNRLAEIITRANEKQDFLTINKLMSSTYTNYPDLLDDSEDPTPSEDPDESEE